MSSVVPLSGKPHARGFLPLHIAALALTACLLQELRASGREPYAYNFNRTHTAAELHQLHVGLGDGLHAEGAQVTCSPA